jgi:tyrosyl-tRNA synthetase
MSNNKFKPVEEQLAYLKKGAAEIIPEAELRAKLENSLKTGKPLRAYLGVDPTAPDIHLGHTVVLRKLKHFQDLGHTAIFLIGDFSAMIGDPTGQSETRPPLTREQVEANAKTYLAQVFKLLDPQKTEVRRNSEWLDKLSSYDIVRICGHYSLARMLEREDFRSRLEHHQPISVHELLYPLLTAYDAVALKSDVELGATEQKFNILVHRDIQRAYGLAGEVAFTMPILVGLDGQRKMSKSLGNYVGIDEAGFEYVNGELTGMFKKIMSVPDALIEKYFELLSHISLEELNALKEGLREKSKDPRDAKKELAMELVARYHGREAAGAARAEYETILEKKNVAAKESTLPSLTVSVAGDEKAAWLPRIMKTTGLAGGTSEAMRLIKQGGVKVDDVVATDPNTVLALGDHIIKVGKKRFYKITVAE